MKYTSILTLTLLAAVPVLAANDLSWVSHSGSDSPNILCATTSPCRTFSWAYNQTNSGGIIKAMDAGEYGPIAITKPIIIDGNGVGAAIEATALAGTGVLVQTTGPVEIRNLAIHVPASCSPCYGIDIQTSAVSIEDVSITGAPFVGVEVAGGTVTIHDLTVTGAGAAGYGISVGNATATISDSIIRYANIGIYVQGVSSAAQALIERSKMISNAYGLYVQNSGAAATARISDCLITDNTTGVSTITGGQIITFRNNAWAGNITDGTTPFSLSLK